MKKYFIQILPIERNTTEGKTLLQVHKSNLELTFIFSTMLEYKNQHTYSSTSHQIQIFQWDLCKFPLLTWTSNLKMWFLHTYSISTRASTDRHNNLSLATLSSPLLYPLWLLLPLGGNFILLGTQPKFLTSFLSFFSYNLLPF